jgi:SAM-dependent methyltransferase
LGRRHGVIALVFDPFDFTFQMPMGFFKISEDAVSGVVTGAGNAFDSAAEVEVEPLNEVNNFCNFCSVFGGRFSSAAFTVANHHVVIHDTSISPHGADNLVRGCTVIARRRTTLNCMSDQRSMWSGGTLAHIGSGAYDFAVEREWLAKPAGAALWGTDTRMLYDSIRTIGELPDGSAVLDVPCGGGVALRGLRPAQGVRYVAADISTDMLNRARSRAAALGREDIEFVEADIERMPFDDNEFDLCVCFNGLHCVPNPAAAVHEIARCLKPGGRLVGDSVVRGAGLRQDLAIGVFRRAGAFGVGGTVDELRGWLTDAGLRVDRLQRSGALAHFTATGT